MSGFRPAPAAPVSHALLCDAAHVFATTAARLRAGFDAAGCLRGRLSDSALSTATAVSALARIAPDTHAAAMRAGLNWLARNRNSDGGFGDTPASSSNLSTSLLVRAALAIADRPDTHGIAGMLDDYIERRLDGKTVREKLLAIYGDDFSFSVPILANLALARMVDFSEVPNLSAGLVLFPNWAYRLLRMDVVSYALPALIAIGILVRRRKRSGKNLGTFERAALRRLEEIQPTSGGFLEAVPLTSFVAMSLADYCAPDCRTLQKCVGFLRGAQRGSGAWAIDVDLACWLTASAVYALGADGLADPAKTRGWILQRQTVTRHAATGARSGGWPWTDLPGGVPDADDTSGALLALHELNCREDPAVGKGIDWLLALQNSDGGWPTFCRGWGRLPFDRSAPELTAHAVRALFTVGDPRGAKTGRAVTRGLEFLRASQADDGSWTPLWFGSQATPDQRNPVYGTARVLAGYAAAGAGRSPAALRGLEFLRKAQNGDGGFGALVGVASSVEETAVAVEGMAGFADHEDIPDIVARAVGFLKCAYSPGSDPVPSPIGLYFASLWYSEDTYPALFTAAAMRAVLKNFSGGDR